MKKTFTFKLLTFLLFSLVVISCSPKVQSNSEATATEDEKEKKEKHNFKIN